MNDYGTWSTFDAPTKDIERALEYLRNGLKDIGGSVRLKYNPHDFGMYPSFEVYKPNKFNDIDEDYSSNEELAEYDAYVSKMNELEANFYKQDFFKD